MTEDEDELWAGAIRGVIRRTTGRRGVFVRPASKVLRSVAHELDLALPLPADAVMERAGNILTSLSRMFDQPARPDPGRRRVRGIVAGGSRGEKPVVVTVDLTPDEAGGTSLRIRAAAKEFVADRHTARKTAESVAELLRQPDGSGDGGGGGSGDHRDDGGSGGERTATAYTWFEVDPADAAEMSDAELAFADALRRHSSAWTPTDADGYVAGFAADGLEEPLVAYADLTDPADPSHLLLSVGVHLLGDRVRGDRLHNQLYSLPERPSPWALDSTGTHERLAQLSADWFRAVLDKPVVLYVWLRDGYPYAARYTFADTGETLTQFYARELAPAGQAESLIAAGHVHGRGWIQTAGLPTPSCFAHIRGDLTKGTVLPGVPAATNRRRIPGVWYEGK